MLIELEQVTKQFGRNRALDRIDLTIRSGARVALLGPNGSGKSTLTRAIMGLVRCDGTIRIDGQPAGQRGAVASRLAYVAQVTPLLSAPVGEVVRAVSALRGLAPAAVAELAGELGLELGRVAGHPVRSLSGGMRQKLFLALALATPADLLILDEPTASLDARARARFLALVARKASGATLILCSHRLDELRALVDHVVALAEGRVHHDGPAADYLAAHQVAVLELRHRGSEVDWFEANAFLRGPGGWWSRAVSPADKLRLLPAAMARYGDELEDIVMRDTDRVELEVPRAA